MTAYDTLANAELYFVNRFYIPAWTNSNDVDKTKVLLDASLRIDRLAFSGTKVLSTQEHEFPRYYGDESDGTEVVPSDIKIACFEIAYSLLDGVNLEKEIQKLAIASESFANVRVTYNQKILDYLAAGIPSFLAWQYLLPYLADYRQLNILRKS